MGDFRYTTPFIFAPNTVIASAQVNSNYSTAQIAHNDAFNASTGHGHTGAAGDGPLITSSGVDLSTVCTLPDNQTITGNKTFSGDLILPSGAVSTTDRAISVNSQVPELYNGTTSHADVLHREDGYNETVYSAADINLGTSTDGSFVDVDATNAKIDFTVNIPGRYKVEFDFSHTIILDDDVAGVCFIDFRLTDGTNNSTSRRSTFQIDNDNDTVTQPTIGKPIAMHSVFNFSTTGSKTVKLQKKINFAQNIISNIIENFTTNNVALVMRAYRISN